MNCPNCSFVFLSTFSNEAINSHIDVCLTNTLNTTPSFSKILYNLTQDKDYYLVWTKIIENSGKEIWKQQKKEFLSNEKLTQIIELPFDLIKNQSFEEKQIWFKFQIETMRISWTQGSDPILITKENIINDTLNFINFCDMHKEIKIYIENDKVNDAGGLFREWIFLLSKELFKSELDLFKRSEGQDFSFKINPKSKSNPEILILYNLVGKILGKSLFERIPLNIYLDISLIKNILNQPILFEDIRKYDSQLYNSLKYLLENDIENDPSFELFFTVVNTEQNQLVELRTNGKDLKVTNSNKKEFVDCLLNFLTCESIKGKIESFLKGFYEVIPEEIISIFTVEEFEILLNGLPFIDVEDWKENTEYSGVYSKDHEKIGWFWKIMGEFNQIELSKLLQYCTGSSRISIEGFRNLESNRGKFCKFCIESIEFNKENLIPRAFTCFNRLSLPIYNTYDEMKNSLKMILSSEFEGVFGLE